MVLNAFLEDIYHGQGVLCAGGIPKKLIDGNEAFLPAMMGFRPPAGIYTHIIIGVDIVRTGESRFYMLKDDARTPSGVSYVLENRETMMQLFPELFARVKVWPVENYPPLLRQSLAAAAPLGCAGQPTVAVLTPGNATRPISSTASAPTRWTCSSSRAATCG